MPNNFIFFGENHFTTSKECRHVTLTQTLHSKLGNTSCSIFS